MKNRADFRVIQISQNVACSIKGAIINNDDFKITDWTGLDFTQQGSNCTNLVVAGNDDAQLHFLKIHIF